MSKGDHLGEFEHLVMLALLRLGDRAYGMRVRREIQTRTERPVSIGSVYATLDRLEQKGYVAWWSASDADAGGRPRKCFRIMPSGAEVLRLRHETLDRMTEGLAVDTALEGL